MTNKKNILGSLISLNNKRDQMNFSYGYDHDSLYIELILQRKFNRFK